MKILGVDELAARVAELRAQGLRVVHCHGVFDLLHVGHIKHLQAARKLGDALVVTLTPDRYVNKGPHRPAFPEGLRAEAMAALSCVDHVAINRWATAVEVIGLLRPSLFVKGAVRTAGRRDFSDAIEAEERAVRAAGGELVFTDEETYSATALINRHLNPFAPAAAAFLDEFRAAHGAREVVGYLEALKPLKVLALGEAILDEYVFCNVMGKTNKEPILAACHVSEERYAGGILAIANHLAGFVSRVDVLTYLGQVAPEEAFIRGKLAPNVGLDYVVKGDSPTIVKRRFIEEYLSAKLFEVYHMQNEPLSEEEDRRFQEKLLGALPNYDLVVVADYGHGLLSDATIDLLCRSGRFLGLTVQTNAGNRGFNFVSKYPRADFICIDEPEARLETRRRKVEMRDVMEEIAAKVRCPHMLVTRGKVGSLYRDEAAGYFPVPAFAVRMVDRIGAGDAVLSLTAPCVATGVPADVIGFIGNVAGAEACAIMGNKSPVQPAGLYRHIASLLG